MNWDARFYALVVRMLAQILIKVHAGAVWGYDEEHVLQITKEAHDMAEELDPGRYPEYVGKKPGKKG